MFRARVRYHAPVTWASNRYATASRLYRRKHVRYKAGLLVLFALYMAYAYTVIF